MRAIVTGGAGFIGQHLVRALLDLGNDVIVVDDMSTHLEAQYPDERAKLIQGRVQDASMTADNINVIFHLASKVGPVGVMRHAGKIAGDNIMSANKVAAWAEWYGCPLVYVSTSEVYGDASRRNSEDDPKVFPSKPSARMEYAVSKLAGEVMLVNRPNLDVRIVRPFNVAGPGQRPEGGFVLPRFVQQALKNEALTVYSPGTQRRSFTHVHDIVDGLLDVFDFGKAGEAYNLGNPMNECSIAELAMEVVSEVGGGRVEIVDPLAIHGPDFKEAADKVPCADKAYKELNWEPKYDRASIIKDTIEYWREQQ